LRLRIHKAPGSCEPGEYVEVALNQHHNIVG